MYKEYMKNSYNWLKKTMYYNFYKANYLTDTSKRSQKSLKINNKFNIINQGMIKL